MRLLCHRTLLMNEVPNQTQIFTAQTRSVPFSGHWRLNHGTNAGFGLDFGMRLYILKRFKANRGERPAPTRAIDGVDSGDMRRDNLGRDRDLRFPFDEACHGILVYDGYDHGT